MIVQILVGLFNHFQVIGCDVFVLTLIVYARLSWPTVLC